MSKTWLVYDLFYDPFFGGRGGSATLSVLGTYTHTPYTPHTTDMPHKHHTHNRHSSQHMLCTRTHHIQCIHAQTASTPPISYHTWDTPCTMHSIHIHIPNQNSYILHGTCAHKLIYHPHVHTYQTQDIHQNIVDDTSHMATYTYQTHTCIHATHTTYNRYYNCKHLTHFTYIFVPTPHTHNTLILHQCVRNSQGIHILIHCTYIIHTLSTYTYSTWHIMHITHATHLHLPASRGIPHTLMTEIQNTACMHVPLGAVWCHGCWHTHTGAPFWVLS